MFYLILRYLVGGFVFINGEITRLKIMIRKMIKIMKADGVMPPYGMLVTPEEYKFLNGSTIHFGKVKKNDRLKGVSKR